MEMSAHTWDGTYGGYNSPTGYSVSVLLRWQVVQEGT